MNKTFTILFSALLVALLSGCGSALKEINAKSLSTRSDVFVAVTDDEAIPSGYANLIIKVSVKTPPTGYYLWEWRIRSKPAANSAASQHPIPEHASG